jgi:hypothetical protein
MKIEKVFTAKHGKVTVYEAELTAPGKAQPRSCRHADGKVKGEEGNRAAGIRARGRSQSDCGRSQGREDLAGAENPGRRVVTYEALYVTEKGKKTEVEYLEDGKPKPEAK